MNIKPTVVIHGIYATALTKLLLNSDIDVNNPSQVITEKLAERAKRKAEDVYRHLLGDRQNLK